MIIFFEESRSNVFWVIWGMLCLRSCKFYYFGMVEPMFCEIFLGSFPGLFVDPSALLGSFGLLLLFWISVFWDSLDLMLLSLLVERHYVCILNILVTVVIPNCWTGVAGGYLPFSASVFVDVVCSWVCYLLGLVGAFFEFLRDVMFLPAWLFGVVCLEVLWIYVAWFLCQRWLLEPTCLFLSFSVFYFASVLSPWE